MIGSHSKSVPEGDTIIVHCQLYIVHSKLDSFRQNAQGTIMGHQKKKGVFPMMKPENLQDRFLNQARKDRTMVTLFLMNGFQLRGTIISFDQFAVLVLSDGKQNLIYKHAISTVQPAEPVKMSGT